jgi:transcriptional regulator with XRE-family HTH domain
MSICNKLIELRNKSGRTQDQVAIDLGVSRKSISNWEQGERRPNIDKLKILAAYYNVDSNYLLSDDAGNALKNSDDVCDASFLNKIIDSLIEDGTLTSKDSVKDLDEDAQQILLGALNKHIKNRLEKHKSID